VTGTGQDLPADQSRRRRSTVRRGVTIGAIVVLVVVLVVGAAALWPFVFPSSDEPFTDGPVVALGGNEARVERAAGIVEASASERPLVLSAGSIEAGAELGIGCDPPAVLCVEPRPSNTFGEARMVAAMAADHGWREVTVVTDPFHLTRSRLLFRRCLDVPVRVVASDTDAPFPGGRLARPARELASATASFVVHWDC
jgi:uncharacterized SAM-binding protein YcdF (DUF218 family)